MDQKSLSKQDDLHRPRIGVDLLGCEISGEDLLKALIDSHFEGQHPPKFSFFATQNIFDSVVVPEDMTLVTVTDEIDAQEDPMRAVRRKKDSSIHVGLQMLKTHDLDAFISAGNTGVLLANAKIQLPMLPGIDRPALITLIPTKKEPVAVLDVGANVEASAETLLQFAQMGIAYQKTRGIDNPCAGLLNIGEEKQKGGPKLRKAYEFLQKLNENTPLKSPAFIGNIEGRDVFHGNIDVLVTDGFTGNVFLKTAEGIAGFVLDQMHDLGPIASLPGLKSLLNSVSHRLHYAEHPGALLCGVDGIVIKCHGASTPESFINSIKGASRLVKNFFIQHLKTQLNLPM